MPRILEKLCALFGHIFFYKMCDSGPFLVPAVQLLMLGRFKTGPLEQKLPMTAPCPLDEALLLKGFVPSMVAPYFK